jgi:hypothetical protein
MRMVFLPNNKGNTGMDRVIIEEIKPDGNRHFSHEEAPDAQDASWLFHDKISAGLRTRHSAGQVG